MSDLLYDTVQEAALEQREEDEPRWVRRVEDSSDDDGRRDLDAALDDQALDLDLNYDDYRLLDSE